MQWNKKDVTQYIDVKEYVDTLLVPLMPITLDENKDMEKVSFQGELVKVFSNEIEKEFTGRVFLLPSYNYLVNTDKDVEIERMNEWVAHAQSNPFSHIFFLTFDLSFKKHESKLNGDLLCFPAMQSGDLRNQETQSMINQQISQVKDLIKSYWQK